MQHRSFLPFPSDSFWANFIQRVKRFSVQCCTDQGKEIWAHTNNTGSMLGLLKEGNRVLLSKASNPERKLAYTLEVVCTGTDETKDTWVGVNTLVPTKMLALAFQAQELGFTTGYKKFMPEYSYKTSRIDAYLQEENKPPLWVECKNVSLVEQDIAYFPDAKTSRGLKHLEAMMQLVQDRQRAAFFYCIQRQDAHAFAPAATIDPEYAQAFYLACQKGVEVYPYTLILKQEGIYLGDLLPIVFQEK